MNFLKSTNGLVMLIAVCFFWFVAGCGNETENQTSSSGTLDINSSGTSNEKAQKDRSELQDPPESESSNNATTRNASTTGENEPAPETPSEPKKPSEPVLAFEAVQGTEEGDLDIYVTNISETKITNCVMKFEDLEIKVANEIKQGQVALCGVGGELPDSIVFSTDQFDDVAYEIPEEPRVTIDTTGFDWALPPEVETDEDGND